MVEVSAGNFAAIAITLYAAHYVGDYWVQRDMDAKRKSDAGRAGRLHCIHHVITYVMTQSAFLFVLAAVTDANASVLGFSSGMLVSGVTHYIADRREPLKRIASWIPGTSEFVKLGMPRPAQSEEVWGPCSTCEGRGAVYDESTGGKCWDCRAGGLLPSHIVITDNPQLATGLWALDQSWHIFWGVFVAALVMVSL